MFKLALLGIVVALPSFASAQRVTVDSKNHTVTMAAAGLRIRLNQTMGCFLDWVEVRGRSVLSPERPACTGIKVGERWITSRELEQPSALSVEGNVVQVSGIRFRSGSVNAEEKWTFTVGRDSIRWQIERTYLSGGMLEATAMPSFTFRDMKTWTGALLGTGGVAWGKLFDRPLSTYGVHTGSATFWNAAADSCFQFSTLSARGQSALRFTREPVGGFSMDSEITREELKPRHDLARFRRESQELWAAFPVESEEHVSATFELRARDFAQTFGRGDFKGFDTGAITELVNTIGRIGVVDDKIIGSNGWYSGYAVLHEPWIGQMGLAIDDPNFLRNYARTLDFQRDHAVEPDGMVKSRWAYDSGDATAGTYNAFGFYEAQWGRLMDTQTSYVCNVADQFDLSGDVRWVAGQKKTCEAALEYLLKRDTNHNGLVEMETDSMAQKRSSDWIDIVWASYENGFVNAQLYHALQVWAGVEHVLGDETRAHAYLVRAAVLKKAFNRPISEGGFWDPGKGWYAYWRDKDGSIHGDNLVLHVNLTALGDGLCDDPARRRLLLNTIEANMKAQSLLAWPSCLFPYAPGEAMNTRWPDYENGDIFLAWAEYGVRAYAADRPDVAFKYVRQIVGQYKKDGLAFQRYLRTNGQGAGDDILANNCNVIVGLYRDIYGIQPKYNRLYLEPHLTPELNGTVVKYNLRGQALRIDLSVGKFLVSHDGISVSCAKPFGVDYGQHRVTVFEGQDERPSLSVKSGDGFALDLQGKNRWTLTAGAKPVSGSQTIHGLRPGTHYYLAGFTLTSDHPTAPIKLRPGQRMQFELRAPGLL